MADFQSNINVNIDTSNALASIKLLQRQIAQFHAQMAKGGAGAQRASQELSQGLVNNINASKGFSAEMTRISSTTESFTSALQKNKLSMGQYFRYGMASTKTFGKFFRSEFNTVNKVARERVKDLQTQYIKMGRDANGAMQAIKVRPLTLDMQNLGTQTAIAAQKQQLFNQLLKQGSTNLLNFGKNTQWAGRQLMVGFTIPLTMLGVAAGRTFQKLEEQAIRFKRVYGELFTPPAEADEMLGMLKDLGSEFAKYGVSLEKTLELAADAAAMGKTGIELLAQVEQASKLAVLGSVEQSEALETTISITNAFGVATEDLAKKINFLNAVENQTVVSIEDLTIAIPKAGPVVKQLGGDVEDLAFFLTAMKEGGINASEGANALKSGIARIINPTEKASEMLGGLGINIRGIVENNAGDIRTTLVALATELDNLDPLNRARAIEELFGKFQFARISTLFQNIVGEGTQASRVLELTKATAAELAVLSERELKRVEESPAYKFQKSLEQLKVSLAPVGEAFLKAATPIVEFAAKVLKRFDEMSEGSKQFIVSLTTIGGVIAPVLLMVIGLVANGVANLVKFFGLMRNYFAGAASSSNMLGEQINYLTQEQLEQLSVAASLDQVHNKLTQRFTAETAAVSSLTSAYAAMILKQREYLSAAGASAAAGSAASPGGRYNPFMPPKYAKGTSMVPGPKGAGDIVPALLEPGEAVIPADKNRQYGDLVKGIIAGNIPGFKTGTASIGGKQQTGFRNQSTANEVSKLAEALGPNVDLLSTAIKNLTDTTGQINATVKEIKSEATMEANRQGRWDTPGLSGTATARTHLTLPATGAERDAAIAAAGYDKLPPNMQRNVSATSNLTAGFPQAGNLRLAQGTLPAEDFAQIWASRQEKLLPTAEAGGMSPTSENKSALANLESDIAQEAVALAAKKTEAGEQVYVSDIELSKAAETVIGQYKRLGGAAEKAATALENRMPATNIRSSQGVDTVRAEQARFAEEGVGLFSPTGSQELAYKTADGDVVKGVARAGSQGVAGSGVKGPNPYSKTDLTTKAQTDAKAYQAEVEKIVQDIYVESQDRSSPHPEAATDGADDGRAYMDAREKAMQDPYKQGGAPKLPPGMVPPTAPQTPQAPVGRGKRIANAILDSAPSKFLGKQLAKNSGVAVSDTKGNVFYDPNQDPTTWAGKMEEQRLRDQTLLNEKRKQLVEEGKTNQELRMAGETVEQGGQELKAAGDKLENAAAQDGVSGTGAAGKKGRMRGGGNLAGGVFMLGSAAMAAQMVPGAVGQAAGQIAAPLMAIGGILPMLSKMPIVIQGLIVAIGLLAYAVYKVNDALNKVRKESIALADAMGTGANAMQKFAQFTGKATATEVMDKQREAEQTPFAVQTGKKTTGEAFFESEDGQAMSEDIKKSLQDVGEDETINKVYLQLGNAIASGAMDALEAQSIAQALAGEFDNTNLAIGVNGKLLDLVTGTGIDALTEPITIEARQQLVEDTFTDLDALLNMEPPSYNDTLVTTGQEDLAEMGIDPVALYEEKGFFGGLGTIFSEKIGQLFTDPGKYFDSLWSATKATTGYTATAEAIALTAEQVVGLRDALQSTEAQIDGITLEFQTKIDKAREEGNEDYALQLEQEMAEALKPFLEARQKAFSLASSKIEEDAGEFRKSVKESLALAFEGADLDTATQLFTKINSLLDLDEDNKLMLQYQLATGTFTLSQIQDIVNDFEDRPEVVEKIIAIGVKTPDAKEVMSIVQTVEDNPALQDGLVEVFSTDNMEEFDDALQAYRAARKVGSIVPFKADNPDVFIELMYANPEKAAEIRADLDALEAASLAGPITNEFAIGLIGEEAFAAIAFMWDSLDENGKKTALYAMTVSLGLDYTDPNMEGFIFGGGTQEVGADDAENTAAAIAERAVNSSITSLFGNDNELPKDDGGAGAGSSLDDLTKKLRDVRDETIKVAKGWDDASKSLNDLFAGGTKTLDVFNGLENQMRRLGAGEPLIELIAGMDPDEFEKRKNDLFNYDPGGKMTGFKDGLKSIGAALNAIALGDYVNDQQAFVKNTENQMIAMTKLTAAGMSYTEAFKAVQDTAFATVIATAASAEELENIVRATQLATQMQEKYNKESEKDQALTSIKEKNKAYEKRVSTLNHLAKNAQKYTDAQIEAIMGDEDLQTLLLNPSIGQGALNKALRQAEEKADLELRIKKLTVEGKQGIWADTMSNAQEAFDAQQEDLQIEFDVAMKEDNDLIEQAKNDLDALQYEIDDFQAQLRGIESQEETINEKYEKRFEALDEIGEANERIARAQQSQLSIADALSRGDIAAAARAAQEARDAEAGDALDLQRSAMEDAQKRELEAVTGTGGLTRKQLEDLIKDRQDKVFDIEEASLEPAQERIRLAQIQLNNDIEALEVQGMTREGWEEINSQIRLATVENYKFVDSLKDGLDIVDELMEKLKAPKPVPKPPAPKKSSGGGGGGGGGPALERKSEWTFAPGHPNAGQSVAKVAKDKGYAQWQDYYNENRGIDFEIIPKIKAAGGGMIIPKRMNMGGKVGYAMGGKVKGYASGGYSMGSDIVPAMLTPGEFVIRRPAVSKYGVDMLDKVNSGEYGEGSVYNYNLELNVKSNSNPDQIANTVMREIKRVDSQRIRGNRF